MSYSSHSLNVLAYANGFTLWHYAAGADGTEVEAAGYFDPANDPWPTLKTGDILFWTGASGGGQLIVRESARDRVRVETLARTCPPAADGRP
jgi:hypothetical protein